MSVTGILSGYTYIVSNSGLGLDYNGATYHTGDTFTGVDGVNTYTDLGGGSDVEPYAAPDDLTNLQGAAMTFDIEPGEIVYPTDITKIEGFAIEFDLAASDIKVPDTTRLTGFAIELIDFPFYSFEIIEQRL